MADAKGIRAGAAYVELAVKDSRLVKGLDAAAKKLKAFGASVAGLGARLVALGGAALAPVAGMVFHFKDAGDALNKMAARTGVSTEALSELGFAAARKEWEEALAEAKRKREEADARVPERMKRPDIPELDEVADTAREKVDIQGTFSALAVRPLRQARTEGGGPEFVLVRHRWGRSVQEAAARPAAGGAVLGTRGQ
jgi:hypothetical protein